MPKTPMYLGLLLGLVAVVLALSVALVVRMRSFSTDAAKLPVAIPLPQQGNKGPAPFLAPMIADPFARCDLDLDGDCDIYDYEIVSGVLGECIGGGRFIDLADADHDGCVTDGDLQKLFPIVPK